jgi:hypothetical protein
MAKDIREHPLLTDMVSRLESAAGDRLVAVVLYGPAAHDDLYQDAELNLMIVLRDLTPDTLGALQSPVTRWLGKKQPMPRFFSPGFIADATDVFPIEFLDISSHHIVLFGSDPLVGLEVPTAHLRLQCERELREKMMRLSEAYIEARGHKKPMRALLADSFVSFVNIFRGCLRLHGDPVPLHDADVVAAFCRLADLDQTPFDRIVALKSGKDAGDLEALFRTYHQQLERAVDSVDRFETSAGEQS